MLRRDSRLARRHAAKAGCRHADANGRCRAVRAQRRESHEGCGIALSLQFRRRSPDAPPRFAPGRLARSRRGAPRAIRSTPLPNCLARDSRSPPQRLAQAEFRPSSSSYLGQLFTTNDRACVLFAVSIQFLIVTSKCPPTGTNPAASICPQSPVGCKPCVSSSSTRHRLSAPL